MIKNVSVKTLETILMEKKKSGCMLLLSNHSFYHQSMKVQAKKKIIIKRYIQTQGERD